jgi:hypothetical protein
MRSQDNQINLQKTTKTIAVCPDRIWGRGVNSLPGNRRLAQETTEQEEMAEKWVKCKCSLQRELGQ